MHFLYIYSRFNNNTASGKGYISSNAYRANAEV